MTDPLLTPRQAAALLGVSTKTLLEYVKTGELHYINMGRGTKKRRRMFTDLDLDGLVERRRQRDGQCQSTSTKTARSTTTTSNSRVIGFTALREQRMSVKPKHLNAPGGTKQSGK
ncbi:hypothetical protein C7G41_24225 [Bradyrhizobium sp. MOS002]|nr:hypothetical protein C7G41_24225 [Bradyrhizobium sp. MOS002]